MAEEYCWGEKTGFKQWNRGALSDTCSAFNIISSGDHYLKFQCAPSSK